MVDNFSTTNGMLDSLPPVLKEVWNVLEEVGDELGQVFVFFSHSMTNDGSQHTNVII